MKRLNAPMLTSNHSEFLSLLERKRCWMEDFIGLVVEERNIEMSSLCLLASLELILRPNCSLLYLHSNYRNSFKSS